MEYHDNQRDVDRNKKYQLFLTQKRTLDLFLQNGAISQVQYDKSLGDLKLKMGIQDVEKPET